MKPLVELEQDAREYQIYRKTLLAQPPEFFERYYGFVPEPALKVYLVEKTVQSTMAPQVFANDIYRVKIRKSPPIVHLDISRLDSEPITCWRDLQEIKNQLVGPECEGVELFPAESRLVDTSHQYHIWVVENTAYRFPFGYQSRVVLPEPVACVDHVDEAYVPGGNGPCLTGNWIHALRAN